MLSANANLSEFIDQVSEQPYDEIILLADREATAAERQFCKQRTAGTQPDKMKDYALLLKDFMVFMRHGVATSALRGLGRQTLAQLPRA